MGISMTVNVSMLRDFLKCPQMSYNRHILRRDVAGKSVALELGTLFHEGMALRLGGADIWNDMYSQPSVPSWDKVSTATHEAWIKHRLHVPINSFRPEPDWEILG